MPHCMVPDCSNHSRAQNSDVSFHRVPADEKLRRIWLRVIPRKIPRPTLYCYVCSDYFTQDCFEVSFMEQLTGHKQPRRLKPGSIPSVFPRSSAAKPRLSSEQRRSKREKEQMITTLSNNEGHVLAELSENEQLNQDAEPATLEENNNMDTTESLFKSVGVQCNMDVKCMESVSVQTDIEMIDREVQTTDEVHRETPSTPVKETSGPPFVSPRKSSCSSYQDFHYESDDSYDSEAEEPVHQDFKQQVVRGKKYIVYENQLLEVFSVCHQCCAPTSEFSKRVTGTMITIQYTCLNGHSSTWNSQPLIKQTPAGNVLLSAAVLFSGNSFSKIKELFSFFNLQIISETKFYEIQKQDLWPVVNQTWQKEQTKVLEAIKEENYVDLCGDVRCDSPGHNAKFGTYTLIEEITGKILNFQMVQVNETTSSNAMKAEGCKRGLNFLLNHEVPIRCLSTDRHITITSNMRKQYKGIVHQYDTWHIAKWVVKKLAAKAKMKDCDCLFAWIQSVSNHLWWSVSTCEGSYVLLKEKWMSIVHHIANKHTWGGCTKFKTCAHHDLTREEAKAVPWLKTGSPAHKALQEVVLNKKLLKDLEKLTEFHHTGALEVYYSLMLKYPPKRQQFSYEGMIARTQLAALDHNFNIGRSQAVTSTGNPMNKVVFPKGRKSWVAKPVVEKKSYDYVYDMMEDVVNARIESKIMPSVPLPAGFCRRIAPEERPDKTVVIQRHVSRFNK